MIQLIKLVEELNLESAKQVSPIAPVAPVEPTTPKLTKDQKKRLVDIVGRYNEYGKVVRRDGNLSDISKTIKEISSLTENYVLQECGDFVEANTAKRKIQELRRYCESFCKLAEDIHSKEQQLEPLYEDVGKILEVFFEIHDVVPTATSVNQSNPALKDPHSIER